MPYYPLVLVRTLPARCAFRYCPALVFPPAAVYRSYKSARPLSDPTTQRLLLAFMEDGGWHSSEEIARAIECPMGHVAPRLRLAEGQGHALEVRVGPRTGKMGRPPSLYRLTLDPRACFRVREAQRQAMARHAIWRVELAPLIAEGLPAKRIAYRLGVTAMAVRQRLLRLGLQAYGEKRQRFCCKRHARRERMCRAREVRARRCYAKVCEVCERDFLAENTRLRVCSKACRREKRALKDRLRRAHGMRSS